MIIRPFRTEDAPALGRLFHDSVHRIARRHYSEAQARAWAPAPLDAGLIRAWAADGRLFLVAAGACGEPLAFGDLEPDGHIDHLFCRPDVAGTGVTAALYRSLEQQARAWKLDLVYVEASEAARRFFRRQGFHVAHRRDFRIRGVAIHNYRMEKRLAGPGGSVTIETLFPAD